MSTLFTAKKIGDEEENEEQKGDSAPLPVDVFRSGDKLVILTPIAGVIIEDISVAITEDVLTISGDRKKPDEVSRQDHFSQECFWGEFSRSIVLPVTVNTNKVAAFYKRGILRIEMPIIEEEHTRVIPVKIEEE